MNRFFFHLASKDNTICDEKGRDLTDLAAAHRHVMLLIHKVVVRPFPADLLPPCRTA